MKYPLIIVAVALTLSVSGCKANRSSNDTDNPPADTASIGSATMQADGTIVLQLRAEGPEGELGDAMVTYKPDDAKYQSVLDHLGGLAAGQTKPVPPWPDDD